MICTSLRLIHIRSFSDYILHPDPLLTILTGRNGAGKTNLIEAASYASMGKSFRAGQDQEVISLGEEEGTILLHFTSHDIDNEIKIHLYRQKGKKIFLNDTPIKKRDLMGLFRTVSFTPDEMQLIKGAPYLRRRFLNNEISQVSPRYYQEVLRYTRAMQQRNAAFKEAKLTGVPAEVDLWDMQMAKSAAYIVKKRLETLEKMKPLIIEKESFLTDEGETLDIRYAQHGAKSPVADEDWFIQELAKRREEDALYAHTSIGPHRDDLQFLLNSHDLSLYGSEGQMRTAVLAVKLSEIELIRQETGEYPVLLLDDVGSELDEKRRSALLSYVEKQHIQTILTTTEFSAFHKGKEIQL